MIILWVPAMHEASVASEIIHIVEQAAQTANVHRISSITLEIGIFSCIQADLLQFAFEVVSKGTVAEYASLTIQWLPAKAWCKHCQKEYAITFTERACPHCGIISRQITGGREALVKEIEGE